MWVVMRNKESTLPGLIKGHDSNFLAKARFILTGEMATALLMVNCTFKRHCKYMVTPVKSKEDSNLCRHCGSLSIPRLHVVRD